MPPSKKYHPVVRYHLINHRVSRGTRFVVFMFLPSVISFYLCPITKMLKCNVNVHGQHYEGSEPIFVNSWFVSGGLLLESIASLDRHVVAEEREEVELIVLFYAHSDGLIMDYGDARVPIVDILEQCDKLKGLRLVGLLGCNSGTHDIPRPVGYIVFGFATDVDYSDLVRFVTGVINHYCAIRSNSDESVEEAARSAISAAYTVFIVWNMVVIFS